MIAFQVWSPDQDCYRARRIPVWSTERVQVVTVRFHQSRNSLISRVLHEVGYMRELGEGMRRMFELMKSNDLTPPNLFSRIVVAGLLPSAIGKPARLPVGFWERG